MVFYLFPVHSLKRVHVRQSNIDVVGEETFLFSF